jgi:hypothetical protein
VSKYGSDRYISTYERLPACKNGNKPPPEVLKLLESATALHFRVFDAFDFPDGGQIKNKCKKLKNRVTLQRLEAVNFKVKSRSYELRLFAITPTKVEEWRLSI